MHKSFASQFMQKLKAVADNSAKNTKAAWLYTIAKCCKKQYFEYPKRDRKDSRTAKKTRTNTSTVRLWNYKKIY